MKLMRCLKLVLAVLFWFQAVRSLAQTTAESNTSSVAEDKVVIRIGEQKITAKEVNKMLESMPPQYRSYYSGPGRKQLRTSSLITAFRPKKRKSEG